MPQLTSITLVFIALLFAAPVSAADAEVTRDLKYRFCLSQFKDYEQARNGDRKAHDELASIPGGNPEILITEISKDKSGKLNVDALYAFSSGGPEKVTLRCSPGLSTISFSTFFFGRVKATLEKLARENDPEYKRQQREKKRALAKQKHDLQARLDAEAEERNKIYAPKIKALIEGCWDFGVSGTWPVRIVVRNGRIVKSYGLSKYNGRDDVINLARVKNRLGSMPHKCPDIPVEGPIVVHLGPTKREK